MITSSNLYKEPVKTTGAGGYQPEDLKPDADGLTRFQGTQRGFHEPPANPAEERREVMDAFAELLRGATGDGSRKRQAGMKPSWKIDTSHKAAAMRHIGYYMSGETVDKDSGQHPLQHAAWRLLAVAWQDTHVDEVIRLKAEAGQ
jgi:hypothetical protein